MIPEPLLSLGNRALRIFRVFGKFGFVRRLHDFLVHEGRLSRAEVLEQTAKAVHELEKADAQRIKNFRAIMELMKENDLPKEKMQAAISNMQEMQRVSAALTTLLSYINNGTVTITEVSEHDPQKDDRDSQITIPRAEPSFSTTKRKALRKRGPKT